ncbi:HNH endonuclease [Leptothrix sp. BB-4]
MNIHYGRVGTKLREFFGRSCVVGGQKSYIFAYFVPPTEKSEGWNWVLHPEVRDALRELHCFDEELLGDSNAEVAIIAAQEGTSVQRLTTHRHRESSLRLAKLQAARAANPAGRLVCEVPNCGFDFQARYGTLGAGYAEVHHLIPLSAANEAVTTTLNDLAVVCSNCHRMIHRGGACRTLTELLQFAASSDA